MKTLEIHGSTGDSIILINERLENLPRYIDPKNSVIITDSNVWRYYGKEFPACEVIEIGTGEGIKTLNTLEYIYSRLVEIEADRSCRIVGIGGGIVCDIAGFIASTYLRGVKFGFVSTTLLSQVDASVGGKNGVNFGGYKNMIGVFNQPEFVICDMNLLNTLPEREVLCGFAEIVKHAVIRDAEMFVFLESHVDNALALENEIIERLVYDSVVIKSDIVNKDEKEKGERRKLNFGHTFGHAIEKTAQIPHGEAISVGMAIASDLSVKRGLLKHQDAERIKALLKRLKLPVQIRVDKEKILDALKRDKKRERDKINFVLTDTIGHAVIKEISIQELEAVLNR